MAVFVLDKRLVQDIHHRFCTLIQRADGYGYSWVKIAWTQGDAGTGAAYAAALSLPGLMGRRPSGLQCTAHNDAGVSRANG